MGRPRTGRALSVWMNGARVGRWFVSGRGEQELRYDEHWLVDRRGRPVSLSMPLRPAEQSYRGAVVANYFENLLPDNERIRARMQARFGTSSMRAFDLLAEVGRDCVGALQLLPEDDEPRAVREFAGTPMTDAQVAQLLRNLLVAGRHDDADDFRISLAGVQEKTALVFHRGTWLRPTGSTPTTHILKLPLGVAPSGIDLRTTVENEWLCAQLLTRFGVPVAASEILHFEDQKVLAVQRFDRRYSTDRTWLLRLPQEDFAQVAGCSPDQKYEAEGGPGIRFIAQTLRGSIDPQGDQKDFFRTQLLFWMLAAIDGHAKNFSVFIEPRGRYRLTPRYDVLSAHPVLGHSAGRLAPEKVKMAMAVWGTHRHFRWNEMRRRHFEKTARDCGLPATASDWIDELLAQTGAVVDAQERELPADFPASVAEPILVGVRRSAARLAN